MQSNQTMKDDNRYSSMLSNVIEANLTSNAHIDENDPLSSDFFGINSQTNSIIFHVNLMNIHQSMIYKKDIGSFN